MSAFRSSQPTSLLLFRILIAYHSPKITCVQRLTSCSSLCNSLNLAAKHVWLRDRAQSPGRGPSLVAICRGLNGVLPKFMSAQNFRM